MVWKRCDDGGILGCHCNGHQTRLFQKIKRGKFTFHEQYWEPISDGAKDLIQRYRAVVCSAEQLVSLPCRLYFPMRS